MPSESGSANGSLEDEPTSRTSSRHTGIFNEAAALINRGGLGNTVNSHSLSSTPTTTHSQPEDIPHLLSLYEKQFLPHQPRSLSGIAVRAFLLGSALALSSTLSIYLLWTQNPLWRAPFFVATLSTFHFLEFYTTALTNTSNAQISSFLLSSNGSAYNIAHTAAFTETILSHIFLKPILPEEAHIAVLVLGLLFVGVGQYVRAIAMLTAGSNFSHVVKSRKAQEHELVTTGIYSFFRHPSYFGFFWWGIGTQLVCGNVVCLVGYAVVLWIFFSKRIKGEEEFLVEFFKDNYVEYRKKTRVGIPFIK